MTTTKTRGKKAAVPAADAQCLRIDEMVLSAPVIAAAAIEPWAKPFGELDFAELVKGVRKKAQAVTEEGDLRPIEAMLYGQAQVLDTIFVNLARRAAKQEYLKQFQTHLTLALKAQAASRATLQALAEVKNPRAVAFVRQTNVAHGPQQVNNGASPAASPTRTEEAATAPNGLLPPPVPGGGPGAGLVGAGDRGEPQEVPR